MRLAIPALTLLIMSALFTPAPNAAAGEVVATVGERTITRAELNGAVAKALNAGYYHRRLTPERRLTLEHEQLDVLVRQQLDLLGGLDNGLVPDLDTAEISRQEIEQSVGAEKYRAALGAAGLTVDEHRRTIAENELAHRSHAVFVTAPAAVSDTEVRQTFENSRESWRRPEELHILHILLGVSPQATDEVWTEREKQAQAVRAQLDEGADFADMALEHSNDLYRIKGGDLGWLHRGRLTPPLEEAVWQAPIGAMIGPVRSDSGYHLAKVLEKRPARAMDFDEAAPMARAQLEAERLQEVETAWYDGLRATYPVVILDPRLASNTD